MKVVDSSSWFCFGCGEDSWWSLIPNFMYIFSVVFVRLVGVISLVCIHFIVTGQKHIKVCCIYFAVV